MQVSRMTWTNLGARRPHREAEMRSRSLVLLSLSLPESSIPKSSEPRSDDFGTVLHVFDSINVDSVPV